LSYIPTPQQHIITCYSLSVTADYCYTRLSHYAKDNRF